MARRWMVVASMAALTLWGAQSLQAATLGIALDQFLGQFSLFVVGLGLTIGLVGITGIALSLVQSPFSNALAGMFNFFLIAGILGGGTVLLGAVGLVGGATL